MADEFLGDGLERGLVLREKRGHDFLSFLEDWGDLGAEARPFVFAVGVVGRQRKFFVVAEAAMHDSPCVVRRGAEVALAALRHRAENPLGDVPRKGDVDLFLQSFQRLSHVPVAQMLKEPETVGNAVDRHLQPVVPAQRRDERMSGLVDRHLELLGVRQLRTLRLVAGKFRVPCLRELAACRRIVSCQNVHFAQDAQNVRRSPFLSSPHNESFQAF